jgi:hypothetical protein
MCPACRTKNAPGAVSCTACDWPFPAVRLAPAAAPSADRGSAPEDGAPAASEAHRIVRAARAACTLAVVAFAVGVLVAHARLPFEPALGLLVALQLVGIGAVWRSVRRRRAQRSGRPDGP